MLTFAAASGRRGGRDGVYIALQTLAVAWIVHVMDSLDSGLVGD